MAKVGRTEKAVSKYNVKVVSKKENELLLALIEGEDKEVALKRIYVNTIDYSRHKALTRVNKIMEKVEVKKRWEELQELMEEEYNRRLMWTVERSTNVLTSIVDVGINSIKEHGNAIKDRVNLLERKLKLASSTSDKDKIAKEIFKLKTSTKQPTGATANVLAAVGELNKLHKLYQKEPEILGDKTPRFCGEAEMED